MAKHTTASRGGVRRYLVRLAVVFVLVMGLTAGAWWLMDGSVWAVVVGWLLGTGGGLAVLAPTRSVR